MGNSAGVNSLLFTLMALIDDLRVTTQYWIPSTTHGFTPVLLDTRWISFWIFFWVWPKMLSRFHLVFIKLSLGLISVTFCNNFEKIFKRRFPTAWGPTETDRRNAASRLHSGPDMDRGRQSGASGAQESLSMSNINKRNICLYRSSNIPLGNVL